MQSATDPALYLDQLRCPACNGPLTSVSETALLCAACSESFPVKNGIPRMLLEPLRSALLGTTHATGQSAVKVATAESFGFEWTLFNEMIGDWERNFREYMAPREPAFFAGKRVLDAGSGKGRHAYYAAKYGAEVWAMDLGSAIEVTRNNTAGQPNVHVVQGDLYQPPFEPESFDFIYSIGVLHHLPEPEAAFANLIKFLKPGGEIQVYLYWEPENQPVKKALLKVITALRRITTRLPHRATYALAYPFAWAAFGGFVLPYRLLSRLPGTRRAAERMPMKQYAKYPFRVCVNDQLDRFSAPIENRYTRAQVEGWLTRAGLENTSVRSNFGWLGSGRKPG